VITRTPTKGEGEQGRGRVEGSEREGGGV